MGVSLLSRRPALGQEVPSSPGLPLCQPPSLGQDVVSSGPAAPMGQLSMLPPAPSLRFTAIYNCAIKLTGS